MQSRIAFMSCWQFLSSKLFFCEGATRRSRGGVMIELGVNSELM